MNLEKIKDILNNSGFSEEALGIINPILDEAIKRTYLTSDEKGKLLALIDLEIEAAHLEADAMEEIALALESFAKEVDTANEKAETEIEAADKDLLADVTEIVDQATTSA